MFLKYAAFIRNIMVGRKGLTREVLCAAFKQGGAGEVDSFLATGNLVFESEEGHELEITAHAAALLVLMGCKEPFFVRSMVYLVAMTAFDPFAAAPRDNIYEQCVTFLPGKLSGLAPMPIQSPRRDVEIFSLVEFEAYSITRRINGRSGYAGALIERQTGSQVTTRNWKTITRLVEKYA